MMSREIKNICFFNHYHNGDLFHSKMYVKDIISSLPVTYYYSHRNYPNIITDVDAEYVPMIRISDKEKFVVSNDTFLINTWIGSYFGKELKHDGECTLRFLHEMYQSMYDDINKILGTDLVLKDINHYLPQTDYTKYLIFNVDNFINDNKDRKKILISNGPCLSGQCSYSGTMDEIIVPLAKEHPEWQFILTHKIDNVPENVYYTGDIIQQVYGSDLNEITYLSRSCDVIVGRNSGPFCFTTVKENINDPTKTFYAFGDRETDCFYHQFDVKSDFIFSKYHSVDRVYNELHEIIGRKT